MEAEFGEYSESKGDNLNDEIEGIKTEIIDNLGEDALDENGNINQIYIGTPIAKKLSERYEKACVALKNADMSDQHEGEIFSHIYQFFSRYYDKGDFMSLRRYSQKEKYAIPYNGEEVVLHWANKDQYYIKTGENFKNYSFKVGEHTVEFLIQEAEDTTNNNKTDNRFFVLASSRENLEYDSSNKKLTIFFEYRGLSKDEEEDYGTKNKQESILLKVKDEIASQVEDSGLKASLTKVVSKGKDKERSLIEKHLRTYTKKNTTDYFIHKDLKGFLVNELDFYIKNEVFHLDDLGTENELSVEQYVTRAKVMKKICLKIIDFLAQIEDFQKTLFEKKKFVVKTDYCMTLDNVPEELYPEIVTNEEQLNEWNILYGIGEEKQQKITSFVSGGIDEVYLKEYPYLVLDTKFFDRGFKDKLLASFDNIDEIIDGLMVNSENWQALNLIQEKYNEKINCIYIDPPYNTDSDDFIYKDNYQHSSWLSLLENRLSLSKNFLTDSGAMLVSINDIEMARLFQLMDSEFGTNNHITNFVWNTDGNIDNQSKFKQNHEYVLAFARDERNIPHPQVIDPNVPNNSKLYRDEIVNTIIKNGPKNPISKIRLPIGFPVDFEEGYIEPEKAEWPKFDVALKVEENKLTESLIIESGWSSRDLLEKFILNDLRPIKDNMGRITTFYLKDTGAPYIVKKRSESHGHVVTVLRNMGSTQSESNNLSKIGIKFDYPKPVSLLKYLIAATTVDNSIIFDFFAGSGPVGNAVINLNKEEKSNRKYILVEMAKHFDTVLKPRIQKIMFTDNWKDGKPQSTDGISHIFKYQSLEQYEDTLNNIEFTKAGTVQRTLGDMDGYFLRYMLDFETRDSSPCKFNVEKLTKPFDYTLKIAHGNELTEETVDLVETFNYLLGIHVKQIRTFNDNGTYYKFVLGKKGEGEIAIVWRNTEQLDLKADKTFIEKTILGEFKPTKTYINSDFYVEGAHPIEPEFKKLMVV